MIGNLIRERYYYCDFRHVSSWNGYVVFDRVESENVTFTEVCVCQTARMAMRVRVALNAMEAVKRSSKKQRAIKKCSK